MNSQTPQSMRQISIAVGVPLISLWIMLILLSHSSSAAPAERHLADLGPNLILNPGFDIPRSSSNMPADWVPVVLWNWPGFMPQLTRVEGIYVSPPASARIWHTGLFAQSAWESKSVVVTPDTLYQLQGSVRTQEVLGIAYIELAFLDVTGRPVAQYSTSGIGRTSGWTMITISVRSPYSAVYARVRCELIGAGLAWFDDISLRQEDWYPPRLHIEKAIAETFAQPGQELPFTLTWANVGSAPANTILITDESEYLDFLSAHPPAQQVNGALVWEIDGPIQPGRVGTITVQARVASNIPRGVPTITNCARISSPETPPISHCVRLDIREITGSVEIFPPGSFREASGPDLPQVVTYSHLITNSSQIPEGIVFMSASPIDWGTIAPQLPYTIPCCILPGARRAVTFTVTISKVPVGRSLLRLELQVVPTPTVSEQRKITHEIRIRWHEALLPCLTRRWPLVYLCNGGFSQGFLCWHPSHTGGQPNPSLTTSFYGNEPPATLFGCQDDDTNEEFPVGCSILYQENVYVPDTSSAVLAFQWHMVTYDILCDQGTPEIDSLDVYVNDGTGNTRIFREGNPCVHTSQKKHVMDWCPPATLNASRWRRDVVSLADWRGEDVVLTFQLCNRDYAGNPNTELYNSWAFIDDVEILEEGEPTPRCWEEWTPSGCDKCPHLTQSGTQVPPWTQIEQPYAR